MNRFIIQIDGRDCGSSDDYDEAKAIYDSVGSSSQGSTRTLLARICGEDCVIRSGAIGGDSGGIVRHRAGAVVLMASGRLRAAVRAGDAFSLEELQKYVGGLIEVVPLDGHTVMVVNEEGKLNGLPVNRAATDIYETFNHIGDFIVGDVVLCYSEEIL